MRAIHLMLGCAVGLCTITTCAAAGVNGVDNSTTSATHMSGESSNHDASPAGDDNTGTLHSRDSASSDSTSSSSNGARNNSNSSGNNASNSDTSPVHFGDRSPVSPTHRDNLGWQSLLPGSIQ